LNEVVKNLLPNKTLQRVKRREARKPIDMGVKQHTMHVYRINTEEIARCPPAFDATQCLTPNEIIDVLLFGTPKSWQCEMDRQGFDPLASTVTQAVEFMERIEMSEDFDGDGKVAAVTKKGNNNKKNPTTTREILVPMAPNIACCMATTMPTMLRSARHSWRKLRS